MAIEIASDNHIGSDECKKFDTKGRGYWELLEILECQENWEYYDHDDTYYWACLQGEDIYYGPSLIDLSDFETKPVWATHILVIHHGK
jgi:hypothetical protein